MLLGTPNDDSLFASSILSSMVMERKSSVQLGSRIGGAEFATCALPNDSTVNVHSLIEMCFDLVAECWIMWHIQGLEVG